MEGSVKTCKNCGCVIEKDDDFEIIGEELYCRDCVDENFTYCECCGEYKPNDEVEEVDGEYVCEDCRDYYSRYYYCEDCSTWHNYNEVDYTRIYNGDWVCNNCIEEYYSCCSECGDWFWRDDMHWDDYHEEYVCDMCMRDRHKRPIKDYSYKPSPVFKTSIHDVFYYSNDIKELMFGVELEIDDGSSPEDCAQEIVDSSEDVYCKHDGSLEDGVEIVTHPCSLSYHMNSLGWENICRIARDYDFTSHEAGTCGLHVHVGKLQLGETEDERRKTIANVIIFVNEHFAEMKKFARRKESQISDWAKKPVFEYGDTEEETISNALMTYKNGRYQAVNLTNSQTIEFRIFNGTLKVSTIYATLQLVNNICKYAMNHNVAEMMDATWEDVVNYEKFDELTEYNKTRKIENVKEEEPEQPEGCWFVGQRVYCPEFRLNGVIAAIKPWEVLVDFGKNARSFMHSASGLLPGYTGWWLSPYDLRHAKEEAA